MRDSKKMSAVKKSYRSILALVIVTGIVFTGQNLPSSQPISVFGSENEEAAGIAGFDVSVDSMTEPAYSQFKRSYTLPVYDGENFAFETDMLFAGNSENQTFINVPKDGLYEIWIKYQNDPEQTLASELSMKIDGIIPFSELRRLQFEHIWLSQDETDTDRYGNEVVTTPYAFNGAVEKGLDDSAYYTARPFLFELKQGSHTLSFTRNDGEIRITEISLRSPEKIEAYEHHEASGNSISIIEAENIKERNSASIHAGAEFNPDLSPYNPSERVMNYLDDASFNQGGNKITYEFTVENDGYYNMTFLYRQGAKADFPVFVDLQIDGKTPSEEAINVQFPYTSSFSKYTIETSSGEKQSFYLTAGKHTVSLTISLELLSPVFDEINAVLKEINSLSMQIIKLTGGITTDKYRDYNLKENIPGVKEQLLDWAKRLEVSVNNMKKYTVNEKTSAFSSINICVKQLISLAEEPEELPRRMNELSQGASSVSRYLAQQMQDMNNNRLGIDRIFIHQSDAEIPKSAGFFYKVAESVKRFFISFTKQDYSAKNVNSESLQIWMSRSRQYVELLQNMADSQFTEETGISVDLSLMPDQGKLVLANASGKSPDLALSVQYVLPSYLAIRNALYDLKKFDSFQEVAQRFPEGLFIPNIVENGVYALPETMNFWVMSYRTDILESMEIPVPNSMEEVLNILPELQRRGMNFYFPTAGMVGLKVFPGTMPVIWQSGGSVFGEQIGRTTLDSEISLAGFQKLTELFTIYDMPVDVPAPGFYQQFRDGTLPIGISDLATYNLLLNAAPEIKGLWSIALFPGYTDDNGNVLRYTTGGAESDMMMKSTKRPEEAWQFLEWWSSAEVQGEYGDRMQSTYGQEFIWNTANISAFSQLPLQAAHKEIIAEQMTWMMEVAWVPGTYMIERELSNAYNTVVTSSTGYRRAMDTAVKRINREIIRKMEEFGYYKDGVMIKQYQTPDTKILWED